MLNLYLCIMSLTAGLTAVKISLKAVMKCRHGYGVDGVME